MRFLVVLSYAYYLFKTYGDHSSALLVHGFIKSFFIIFLELILLKFTPLYLVLENTLFIRKGNLFYNLGNYSEEEFALKGFHFGTYKKKEFKNDEFIKITSRFPFKRKYILVSIFIVVYIFFVIYAVENVYSSDTCLNNYFQNKIV